MTSKTKKQSKLMIIFQCILIFIMVFMVVSLFIVIYKQFISPTQNYKVSGNSMYVPLQDGDVIEVNTVYGELKRYDIVLFKETVEGQEMTMVKRVIGLPYENVEYKEGQLYVDGEKMDEPYKEGVHYLTGSFKAETEDNCYFLMGDNRRNSIDSRVFGCVKEENIMGVVKGKDKTH